MKDDDEVSESYQKDWGTYQKGKIDWGCRYCKGNGVVLAVVAGRSKLSIPSVFRCTNCDSSKTRNISTKIPAWRAGVDWEVV